MHQGYFFRKIPATNANFAPKYVNLQGWPLEFGQDVKIFQPKIEKQCKNKLKITKKKICV